MIENRTEPGMPTPLTRYIHANHQGSSTLETNDNGDIITYEEYHPYGTTSNQATNSNITAAAKRYRYTGMERDEETGLSYHNARYYVPWLGRWLNPDPIGINDGVNVYSYCWNNPVTKTDSQGTQTDSVSPAKRDNTKFQPHIDFKTLIESGKRQAEVNTAKKAEAHNQQVNAQLDRDNLYGPSDPQFWVNRGDNGMAQRVATRNLAKQEGGLMAAFIGVGHGLDKVGELGAPYVAAKSLRGSAGQPSLARQTNYGVPIEPTGTGKGSVKSYGAGMSEPTTTKRKAASKATSDPDISRGSFAINNNKEKGVVIALGRDIDLANLKGRGATSYLNAGWQKSGLTKVDWGRAAFDISSFKESFREAAKNASGIIFDVSNFDPNHPKPGITSYEFKHIIGDPSLLAKTTFIQNGVDVLWNGSTFVKSIVE